MSKKKKSEQEGSDQSTPQVFRVVELKNTESHTRRDFISKTLKALGATSLLSTVTACDTTSVETFIDEDGNCTCHVVCTCDAEAEEDEYNWDSEYNGSICTCNKVCTCNAVCTCDSEGGGGGGHYWYPN